MLKSSNSFFNELEIGKELCFSHLIHFLTSLTQEKKYAPVHPFHFLNSLTWENNHAQDTLSFFNEIDIGKEPCSELTYQHVNT